MEKEKDIIHFLQSIIDKKFDTKTNGYDPKQVDQSLDSIVEVVGNFIARWNTLCDDYQKLKHTNKSLTEDLDTQKKQVSMLESKINRMESAGLSSAIINDRLNAVEKKLSQNTTNKTAAMPKKDENK